MHYQTGTLAVKAATARSNAESEASNWKTVEKTRASVLPENDSLKLRLTNDPPDFPRQIPYEQRAEQGTVSNTASIRTNV